MPIIKNPILWLFVAAGLIWAAIIQFPDSKLHVYFCDVGQGDATLIIYKNTQILIDGGPNAKIMGCLGRHVPFWDRDLELVILSHPQADHFGGLIDVIKSYRVKQFALNSIWQEAKSWQEFYKAVLEEGASVYSPKQGDILKLGHLKLKVLWPEEKLGMENMWRPQELFSGTFRGGRPTSPSGGGHDSWNGEMDLVSVLGASSYSGDLNDTSIVLRLDFGKFCAMFTGDSSSAVEEKIADKLQECQVLKVAHHGSRYSTDEKFLEKLKPELAVILVGKNSFEHPSGETIQRIQGYGDTGDTRILRTDEDGEVEVESDGEWWGVRK